MKETAAEWMHVVNCYEIKEKEEQTMTWRQDARVVSGSEAKYELGVSGYCYSDDFGDQHWGPCASFSCEIRW